jgi:membrane protease YdiL (CAAX protease family)
MATDFDCYRILQVDPAAEPEVIEAAYRRLARKYHPDVSADPSAGERMREINAAYAILGDATQREEYDARRRRSSVAIAAEEPPQPPAREAAYRTPWTLFDIVKAIGLVIVGLILTSIPFVLVAEAIASGDVEDDATAFSITLMASLVLELLLLGAALHFSVRKYHVSLRALGLRWPERGGWLFPFGLAMSGLVITYVYFGILALAGVEPKGDIPKQAFDNLGPLIIIGVLSLAFAPVMEEIFFRGFVFGGLRGRFGMVPAAVASGLLFGLAHVGNPGTIYVIGPICMVGVLFAWGYWYSGSILQTMAAHFLFNLVAFSIGLAFS